MLIANCIQGMDIHYITPSEDDLKSAMQTYTQWWDSQIKFLNVDYIVDYDGF
jgi:hypothetical protein